MKKKMQAKKEKQCWERTDNMIILSHTVHADDFVAKTIFNTETNWNKKQFLYPYFFKPIVILKIKVNFCSYFPFLRNYIGWKPTYSERYTKYTFDVFKTILHSCMYVDIHSKMSKHHVFLSAIILEPKTHRQKSLRSWICNAAQQDVMQSMEII